MLDLSATERQMALNEVRVLATLDHPNIVTYYDSFERDGVLMIGGLGLVESCHVTTILTSDWSVSCSAANRSIGSTTGCTITEKAPTRAFSWLKAATTAFTFKTLLRHYAKRALTPRFLNMKLGLRRNYHKGRVGWLAKRP